MLFQKDVFAVAMTLLTIGSMWKEQRNNPLAVINVKNDLNKNAKSQETTWIACLTKYILLIADTKLAA